jgi:anti-sigma factor RsiW
MSCDPVRRVIPLYVEGDLPAAGAERVRAHVDECLPCRSLLEGYKASQRALRALGAPPIAGNTLDGLRRTVWRRIATLPPRSALGRQVDRAWIALRQWTAQPAMAALMVFVVVGGSFALSRVTGPGARPEGHAGATSPSGRTHAEPGEAVPGDESGSDEHLPGEGDEAAELLAQASFDDSSESAGEPAPEPTSDEAAGSDDSLRIEIQTRDPNVRIIWFSPTGDHPAGVED